MSAYEQAVKLALMVAESDSGQAGPNTARVLAIEVRRLQQLVTPCAATSCESVCPDCRESDGKCECI